MRVKSFIFLFVILLSYLENLTAQHVERARLAEWEGLVYGGRFMDLFLSMPAVGELT